LPEGEEQSLQARARSVFDKAATKVVRDMMSNARIQCVCLYYKKIKQQDMNKKLGASEIYLREDEYLQVDISGLPWLRKCPDAWRALCAYWASPSFVEKSKMKRANHQAGPRVTQRHGADGHLRLTRRMEVQSGVAPSYIETYIQGHHGTDPTQPELLCSENATQPALSSRGYERESRLQEQIRQHREAMQRHEEWARQQHEYMQSFFAQQRQLQEMLAATLGSQFNLPPLPLPPPPPPTFVPYMHPPSPQVGSTSSHPRGVSGSPSTPPSTAHNISGGDGGSGT
jgi:hypothetical protein